MAWFPKAFVRTHPPAKSEGDRIADILLSLLGPQVRSLGFDIGQVPVESLYVSANCRGYLFGLASGIVLARGVDDAPDEHALETVEAAFRLVYGEQHGRVLAARTIADVNAIEMDVLWACEWAMLEIEGISADGDPAAARGFTLAASGQFLGR